MEIFDISVPISPGTPLYPGDPSVQVIPASRTSEGQGANISEIRLGSHTSTHIDPPFHFIDSGITVDQIPLDVLIGECLVCEIPGKPAIRVEDLEKADIPAQTRRIVFKTRNSEMWRDTTFHCEYTYIDEAAADRLVDMGIRLVGIDYLSVDKFGSGSHPTHVKLLEAGIVVLEGVDLRDISPGIYTLACLPLKILGGDGGPARVVLMK